MITDLCSFKLLVQEDAKARRLIHRKCLDKLVKLCVGNSQHLKALHPAQKNGGEITPHHPILIYKSLLY